MVKDPWMEGCIWLPSPLQLSADYATYWSIKQDARISSGWYKGCVMSPTQSNCVCNIKWFCIVKFAACQHILFIINMWICEIKHSINKLPITSTRPPLMQNSIQLYFIHAHTHIHTSLLNIIYRRMVYIIYLSITNDVNCSRYRGQILFYVHTIDYNNHYNS